MEDTSAPGDTYHGTGGRPASSLRDTLRYLVDRHVLPLSPAPSIEVRARHTRSEICAVLLLASSLGAVACGSRTGLEVPRDASVATDGPQVASCGPETCVGCCSGAGACLAGDAQASCGEQGRACVACQITLDEICNPQPGQPDERVCWAPCDPRLCSGGC